MGIFWSFNSRVLVRDKFNEVGLNCFEWWGVSQTLFPYTDKVCGAWSSVTMSKILGRFAQEKVKVARRGSKYLSMSQELWNQFSPSTRCSEKGKEFIPRLPGKNALGMQGVPHPEDKYQVQATPGFGWRKMPENGRAGFPVPILIEPGHGVGKSTVSCEEVPEKCLKVKIHKAVI